MSAPLSAAIAAELAKQLDKLHQSPTERLATLAERDHKRDYPIVHSAWMRVAAAGHELPIDNPLIDGVLFTVLNELFGGSRLLQGGPLSPPYIIVPIPLKGEAAYLLKTASTPIVVVNEYEVLVADAFSGLAEELYDEHAQSLTQLGLGCHLIPGGPSILRAIARARLMVEPAFQAIALSNSFAKVLTFHSNLCLGSIDLPAASAEVFELSLRYWRTKYRVYSRSQEDGSIDLSGFYGYLLSLISHELFHLFEPDPHEHPYRWAPELRWMRTRLAEGVMREISADSCFGMLLHHANGIDAGKAYLGHLLCRHLRCFHSILRVYAFLGRRTTSLETYIGTHIGAPRTRAIPTLFSSHPTWIERISLLTNDLDSTEFPAPDDAIVCAAFNVALETSSATHAVYLINAFRERPDFLALARRRLMPETAECPLMEEGDEYLRRLAALRELSETERADLEASFDLTSLMFRHDLNEFEKVMALVEYRPEVMEELEALISDYYAGLD